MESPKNTKASVKEAFVGLKGLILCLILSLFEFFILYVFIEKGIDCLDGKAGRDLPEGIDFHLKAFQFLVYAGLLFFFLLFGHLSLRLLAYLTQTEFFWLPLADLKLQKLP